MSIMKMPPSQIRCKMCSCIIIIYLEFYIAQASASCTSAPLRSAYIFYWD